MINIIRYWPPFCTHTRQIFFTRELSTEGERRHLDPGGEDSLVVEDGVADAEAVEVVVLDARSHAEPGLEATRPGLQESRLRKGNVGQQGGKEGIG